VAEIDEAGIRARVASLAQAIRRKDVAAVMTHYAPDVVVYDVFPPLETRGTDGYRKNFERWFAKMSGPIEYEMEGMRVSLGESHAFCHYVGHIRGVWEGGQKADYRVRVTTGFQKVNGQWMVAHEHVSMPARM
jgi:uncharacterized protein (TIGR02246 family)